MTETSSKSQRLAQAMQHEDINILALLAVLWRGKLWIFFAMVLFVFLGGYYAYKLTEPEFSASSVVVFSPDDTSLVDLKNIMGGGGTDTDSLNTEVATIRSRETLEQVVAALNLTEVPEFNPSLLDDPDAFSLIGSIKALIEGGDDTPPLTPEQQAAMTLRATTDNLRAAISVRIERDTYLLNITATSTSPDRAAAIANTLAEIYIANRQAKAFSATEQAIAWLSDRVRELENELRDKEKGSADLQSASNLINRDVLEQIGVQAKDFRDRLRSRQDDLAKAQARLTLLEEAQQTNDSRQIAAVFDDPLLQRMLQNAGADTAEFQARIDMLLASPQAEVTRLTRKVDTLVTSVEQMQAEIDKQTDDLRRLEQMQRELAVTRDLYQTFLTGLQEVTVQVGLVQSDASVMSRALPPLAPFSPNTKRILVVSALLGGMLVAAWLLIQDSVRTTVRTGSELEAFAGRLVMGELPRMPVRRRKELIGYLRDNPTSPAVEAIRNLRTSLLLSGADNTAQVIMLTSSTEGEGKTTLAISLAMNLAGLNKRVLIIEGDIRRTTLAQYFQTEHGGPTPRMGEVLEGQLPLADAVQTDITLGVDILLATRTDTNPADVLSSQAFRDLLDDARTHYDHIIVDTPPVLVVPDARVLAPIVDNILFVVKWNTTLRAQVAASLRQFEAVGQQKIGLALTQIDIRKQKHYDYGAQYSSYGVYNQKY